MRYFFDIRDDFYASDDPDGEELAGPEAARREAIKIATSIAGDVFVSNGAKVAVTVRDGQRSLFEVIVTLSAEEI